jgi:hypothetical protein
MNLNPTVRWLLGGAAAVVGYLAASDPFGLPPAVQGGIAVLSVLFAALGITLTAQPTPTEDDLSKPHYSPGPWDY